MRESERCREQAREMWGTSEKLSRQHWMARWMKTSSQGRGYQRPLADQDPVMTVPRHQSAASPCPDSHLGFQRSHGALAARTSLCPGSPADIGASAVVPLVSWPFPQRMFVAEGQSFLYFDWSLPDRTDGKTTNLAPVQRCFPCLPESQVSWVPLRSIPLAEASPSYTPGAQHMPTRWVERVDGRSDDQPSSSDRSDFQTAGRVLGRPRQEDCCKFEANLVYKVNYRPVRAT